MKKLFLFALPLLLISCKGVEQYRASIEELSGNWDNTTKALTDFSAMVSSDLTNYTKAMAGMNLDEMVAKKLKPEQTNAWNAAQKAVMDALGAYPPFQKTINEFVATWTEKSAEVTALKDGLTAGKIEGDVPAKIADLSAMVTTANDNLKAWQGSYGAIKSSVDAAMNSLGQMKDSLSSSVK